MGYKETANFNTRGDGSNFLVDLSQIALPAAGAAIGAFAGNPMLGYQVGNMGARAIAGNNQVSGGAQMANGLMGIGTSFLGSGNNESVKANGGNIPQVMMYNGGGTHEQNPLGGIPVDGLGNPSMQSTALVEANEVGYKLPNDKSGYVFSDRIKYPGKKGTYSDEAKRILGKYKNRLGKDLDKPDALAKKSLDSEIASLKEEQEYSKAIDQQQQQIKAYGGYLKKLAMGGPGEPVVPPTKPALPVVGTSREVDPNTLDPWAKVTAKMTEYGNILGKQLPQDRKQELQTNIKTAIAPLVTDPNLKGTARNKAIYNAKMAAANQYGEANPDFKVDPNNNPWADDYYDTKKAYEMIEANKGYDQAITRGTLETTNRDAFGARNLARVPGGPEFQRELNNQVVTDSLGYDANTGKYTMYTKGLRKGKFTNMTGFNPADLNQAIDPQSLKALPNARYKSRTFESENITPATGVSGPQIQAYGGGLPKYDGPSTATQQLPNNDAANYLKGAGYKEALTGYGMQAATRIPQLFTTPEKISYDRVNPELIDLAQERANMQTSRNAQLGMLKRQASMAGSAGQALNYLGSVIPAAYNQYDQGYNQSIERETNANAQIRNQANAQNAQIQMREAEANAMERDAARSIRDKAIADIGDISAQGYGLKSKLMQGYYGLQAQAATGDYGIHFDESGQYILDRRRGATDIGKSLPPINKATIEALLQNYNVQNKPVEQFVTPELNLGVELGGDNSFIDYTPNYLLKSEACGGKLCKGGYIKKKGKK